MTVVQLRELCFIDVSCFSFLKKQHQYFTITYQKDLFSEENKVPRTLFEARNAAGSATHKQMKTVRKFVVP